MKMRTCFAVAATFIAVNCAAGLFDAVKNVAGGVVGMGNSCQATMPSGANCKNAPVDGSSYCMQHKCRMCNELAWADGLCRNCVPKAEAEAKAKRRAAAEADRRRRMKADERARLGQGGRTSGRTAATAESRRVQTGRRRVANSENEIQDDERPFAGFELGRIAPFGKEKGERIKLKNSYLSIFEEAYLSYGANSHLLNRIWFGSFPIHADTESDLQPYVDKVLSGLKSYGYDMQLDERYVQPKPWRFKGKDCEITFGCKDVKRTSDGVADTYKQLVLTVENPKARLLEKEYANKNSSGDGVVHEIVPFGGYGSERFLHCRSGAIYSIKTNNIAWCNGTEESIVKKNGGVLKLPRKVTHSAGLGAQGEYLLSPYSIGALRLQSEKTTKVVDLTEFEAGDLSNATAFAKACSSGFRIVLADQAVSARWLAELAAHTSRRFAWFLGTDEVSGRQQATKALTLCEKDFQFPADSFCSEHPLLYKDLASGASKDWCRIWLALNAESYDEKEAYFDAKVGEHQIHLSFAGTPFALVSVTCKFKGDGVNKDALIAKYKAQFGDDAEINVTDNGVKMNKSVSSLPRSRKSQRELDSMRMSNSGLARAVANYADETDPFGEATLDSPAEVFYQRGETITISCKTTKVFAQCDYFKSCVFLGNRSYNRLVDSGRLGLIEDCEKVPADAIIDGNCESEIVNDSCGDELRGRMSWIKERISSLKDKNGNVLEMTIVGLPLQTALDAERQKRALKAKAEAEVQRKEKEAATLNF